MRPISTQKRFTGTMRMAAWMLAAAAPAAFALVVAPNAVAEPPAMSMDSGVWETYYEAQHLESAEGDLKGASSLYDRILESDPSDRAFVAEVLYRQGVLLEKLSREKEARRNYEKILTGYSEVTNIVKVVRVRLIKMEERANSLPSLNVHFDFEEGTDSFILYDWGDESADLIHSTRREDTRVGKGALCWRTVCGADSYNAIYLSYKNPIGTLGAMSFWIRCADQPVFLNLYIREKDQSTYDVGYFEIPAREWVHKVFRLDDFRLTTAYYDENGRIDFDQIENIIIEDATGYHDTTTGHSRSLRGANTIFLDDFVVSPLGELAGSWSVEPGAESSQANSGVGAGLKDEGVSRDDPVDREQDAEKDREEDQTPTEEDAESESQEQENEKVEKNKNQDKVKEKRRKKNPSLGTRVPRRPFPLPISKNKERGGKKR